MMTILHFPEFIIKAYKDTLEELIFWEKYCSENKYVAGDKLTIADFAFYPGNSLHDSQRSKIKRISKILQKYCEMMSLKYQCKNEYPSWLA